MDFFPIAYLSIATDTHHFSSHHDIHCPLQSKCETIKKFIASDATHTRRKGMLYLPINDGLPAAVEVVKFGLWIKKNSMFIAQKYYR